MQGRIIAIDPGNIESGYVVVEHDYGEIQRVIECGKVENDAVFGVLKKYANAKTLIAIEMIASYGMAVGKSVFDTCVWVGRFTERALYYASPVIQIYRKDEKMNICGTLKAKDANITRALADRYASGEPNFGKGTKDKKGFFYGFKADIWQAFAVAVTCFDMYVRCEKRK